MSRRVPAIGCSASPLQTPPLLEEDVVARHRRHRSRLSRQALGWALFATAVAVVVVVRSGSPAWQGVAVGVGGTALALAVYGLQRSGLMDVRHLEDGGDEPRR